MMYRVIAIVAFVALFVGVVVLSGGERQGAAPVTVGGRPQDPGYSAKQARLIQTGTDGQPLYTLDAAQVQQQPEQGIVNMQQVVLGFKDAAGDQWTARAARGQLAQNSGIVQLEGAVHVTGIVPGTEEPADITSEHLAFDTNSQVVTTRDPVTLLMSGRKLDAQGMVANLKERRVQLESAVHGTYSP
jgi:lipopolysaccharide export system protein LptC